MSLRLICLSLLGCLILTFAWGCSDDDPPVVTDPDQDLTVVYVTSELDTSDLINNDVWDDIDESFIRIGESETYTNQFGLGIVRARAVADPENVYIRLNWSDDSQSIRPGFWNFFEEGQIWRQNVDSTGFQVTNALNPRWANDDQIALIIDNGNNGSEGANCALMCHAEEDSMWIGGGGTVDVWIWRAGRTNPLGLADDMIWGTDRREFDDFSQNRASWRRNAVSPDEEFTEPAWMHLDGPDYMGDYLFTEDTIQMDFTGQQYNWQAWDGVPGFVLERYLKPSEAAQTSRYDVHAKAEYDGLADIWTVVLWRKLNTGNEDDITFSQGTSYSVSLAIMDHTDQFHSGSRVFTLKF